MTPYRRRKRGSLKWLHASTKGEVLNAGTQIRQNNVSYRQHHMLCSCLSPTLASSTPIQGAVAEWLVAEHPPHSVNATTKNNRQDKKI